MKTKIIVTIGSQVNRLDDSYYYRLMQNGISGLRFNFARFQKESEVEETARYVENLKRKFGDKFSVVMDIPVPKRKVRIYNESLKEIVKGEDYTIRSLIPKHPTDLVIDCEDITAMKKVGTNIAYGDGETVFCVKEILSDEAVKCKALNGCRFKSGKAVHFGKLKKGYYNSTLAESIRRIMPNKVALSFVENAGDVVEFCKESGLAYDSIIAKIETQEGIERMEDIVALCDIMLGRGDLQHYSDFNNLFAFEMEGKICSSAKGKNLYIATGILKDLERRAFPTPAEIIDLSVLAEISPYAIILNSDTAYYNLERAVFAIREVWKRTHGK